MRKLGGLGMNIDIIINRSMKIDVGVIMSDLLRGRFRRERGFRRYELGEIRHVINFFFFRH